MRRMVVVLTTQGLLSIAAFAGAQETRGTISGTVVDQQAVGIPGATVTITNEDTNVPTHLTTNSTGYYEAPLLLPGNYQVTAQLEGFKTSVRSGLILPVGQRLTVNLTLEIGTLTEGVSVTAEAPLLDTNSVTTGQNFDRRTVDSVPMFANMPVLLTRFVGGVNSSANVPYVAQGYVNRTSLDTSSPGNVGSNEWTIDGATNNGSDRRLASSPNSDMIQEMRIETANFDASFGHGTGLGISMMTRAGTNTPRGHGQLSALEQSLELRQLLPAAGVRARRGRPECVRCWQIAQRGDDLRRTGGHPRPARWHRQTIPLRQLFMGRHLRAGQTGGNNTVPTRENLQGDFSNLLAIDPQRYQIYDPLTIRPDPGRLGHFIRDPFPNNIIPPHRIVNPMYDHYVRMLPGPNNAPDSPGIEPFNNYYSAGEPDPINSHIYGARIDYNHSERHRFFFRWSGSRFTEGLGDWTYESMPGLHSRDTLRKTLAGTLNWTFLKSPTTIIDSQLSTNRYHEGDRWLGAAAFTPTDVGLPAALDERCAAQASCSLPFVQVGGYTSIGGANPGWFHETTNVQGTLNITNVRGEHTIRSGLDIRRHARTARSPGAASGHFIFDNTYTRGHDDDIAPAGDLGLSWAAFMLGVPTVVNAPFNSEYETRSPYYAAYVQDSWRATRNLTVSLGLRFEIERGITERDDRMIVGFDQDLELAISDLATAAYTHAPLAELPASDSTFAAAPSIQPRARKDAAPGRISRCSCRVPPLPGSPMKGS